MTVTNLPFDEGGNVRVTVSETPRKQSFTQEIVVLDINPLWSEGNPGVIGGGVILSDNSTFAFGFNSMGSMWNVTEVYVTTIFRAPYRPNLAARFTIIISNQSEDFELDIMPDNNYLTYISLRVNQTDSIQEGMNVMQMHAHACAHK